MRRFVVVLGTIVITAGCGSSGTAPTPKLVVMVTGPATVQGHDTTIAATSEYVCYYQLTATASGGSAGEVATWKGGHSTFVLGATGQTIPNPFSNADVFFGDDPLVTTTVPVNGADYNYWAGPFSASFTFYYSTPQTSTDSATYSLSCT
jgi:hypothetical protein